MEFDPVTYLASKGYRGKPVSGGREIVYPCWADCGEPSDSRKLKLYVNAATGLWQCKVCGVQGGPYTLQKHFGDEPRPGTNDDIVMRQRILDKATEVGETMLSNSDDVMLYLINDRGLTPETIIQRRFGFVAGGWSLTGSLPEGVTTEQLKASGLVHREGDRAGKDFFYRHVLIPIIRHGHTVQIRGRAWGEGRGPKYATGPGEPTRVFNADGLEDAEECMIIEGEFDTAVVDQHLQGSGDERAKKLHVLGLPGTGAVPDDFMDLIAHCKRVYVGFDGDDPGRRAAKQLEEKIGSRARVVELPYENGIKCDWTEYLLPARDNVHWKASHPYAGHTWRDVMRLVSHASGRRIFSVAEAGDAFRAFRQHHEGVKTGFLQLDYTLKPGLLPGQVLVVLAKTGAGKTVWLCNLAYNQREHRILFFSLEMTREEVYDRLQRIYLFHHPKATTSEIDYAYRNVWICDENRLGEREFENLVAEFTLEVGAPPEVCYVDYLGYYARGARGNSPYEKATNAVMDLKRIAKANRMVIITPSQVNRVAKEGKPIDLDDARDSGAVEETADFLLALFRPDDAVSAEGNPNQIPPSGKVNVSVLKSRHGGKGNQYSLQMDLLTLAVVDDNTPQARRAMDHNFMSRRGMDWDDLRRQETAPEQLSFTP